MRTDAIDLEIYGTRLRVICEDERCIESLRSVLVEHVVEEPAPLGFALRAPKGKDRLFVVLDRSGLVLGRSRSPDECLAVLASHLEAFVPAPSGTTRLRMRTLISDKLEAVLAPFPVLASPPMVERRLERAGHRMIDRLAVDLTPDGILHMSLSPWPALARLGSPLGHATARSGLAITTVLVPEPLAHLRTRAGLTWMFATAAVDSSPQDAMTIAEHLAQLGQLPVLPERPSTTYKALAAS